MHLTLSLTHNCNLSCSYCYAGVKKNVVMSRETAIDAVEMALAVRDTRRFEVGFFGGEPLLEWDLLTGIIGYVQQRCETLLRKYAFTLTTNGTLLTNDKMKFLRDAGCYMAVSIDGNRPMHDCIRRYSNGGSSWDACRTGLETALALDASTETITVVNPLNVGHCADGAAWLADTAGVTLISINPDFYTSWNPAQLALLAGQMERITDHFIARYRAGKPLRISFIFNKVIARLKGGLACGDHCGFGRREIAVAPSGRIYPCERLVGNDTDDAVCIGTVAEGIDGEKVRALHANRAPESPACVHCSIRTVCQNSCGCTNYLITGNAGKVDGLVCFFERTATKAADRAAKTLFNEKNRWFLRDYYGDDGR